ESRTNRRLGEIMQDELNFWNQVKENLKSKNLNNKPLQMWFEPTSLVGVEDRSTGRCFILGVPTELHKYWISQNLLDRICSEISALYQNPFQIELVVTGEAVNASQMQQPPLSPDLLEEIPLTSPETPSGGSANNRDLLNTDYTFSTFVV